MIKTNEFRLNEQELKTAYYAMQYAYLNRLKLLILASFIIIVFLPQPQTAIFAGCISYYVSLKLGCHFFKKKQIYQETSFIEINDDFISQTYENGCVLKLNLNLIQLVVKKDDVYVFMKLYQMPLIFPARALTSGEEIKLALQKNVFFQFYD